MHLIRLHISKFRVFNDITLYFKNGINILIGENNSGKTAIIDALRICLGCGKPDNYIYIQESDLHVDPQDPNESNSTIQFDLIFEFGTAEIERECFYDFISQDEEDPTKQTIQLHLKFIQENNSKKKYFKRIIWGGDNEGQQVPYESLQEIFYTYLSPLRDAVSCLRPYSYDNKTSQLFNQLTKYHKGEEDIELNEEKKNQLAKNLYQVFENDACDWKHILTTGKGKVNAHLEGTGITRKHPNIEMNYVGRKFSDVVRGIELKCPVYKTIEDGQEQRYFELYQNGLGENNLIFTSVVLGDLINRCEDHALEIYNALLVEEPEAHLHPQYQNTFFEYLNELQSKGLQIFVTSHSPTITAKSDVNNISVLQREQSIIQSFSFDELSEVDYPKESKRHLRKFLDTTKAQLFFANGVLLVEGVAEAIIIPILAKKFLTEKIDLCKSGIELVNIGGVAFNHFGLLFNNDDERKRLLSKCAIITDSDPKDDGDISDRAQKAKDLEKHNLKVCLAPHTLEHDLFEQSERNKTIMREVYRNMHTQTDDLRGDFNVSTLMGKLKSNKDKAEFALQLYDRLEKEEAFDVPDYIKDAILFVVPTE